MINACEKSQNLIPSIHLRNSETLKQNQNDILTNYFKAFNNKLIWNLMPVKSQPHFAAYHQTNLCTFCNFFEETVSHLFLTCVELNSVWDFIIHLLFKLIGYTIFISHCQKQINTIVFIKYYKAFNLDS